MKYKCPQCGLDVPEKCPKCGKDVANSDNMMCGRPIIPNNHCFNCWCKS